MNWRRANALAARAKGGARANRAARANIAPRAVATCWALSVAVGLTFLLAPGWSAAGAKPTPLGPLSPATLTGHLSQALGPRDQLRVDAVLGAEVAGVWSISAHVTWLDAAHTLRGAEVTMPPQTGIPLLSGDNTDPKRLPVDNNPARHARGLTLQQVSDLALRAKSGELAVFSIASDVRNTVSTCAGTKSAAPCAEIDRTGHVLQNYTDSLTLLPGLGPVAVMQNHPHNSLGPP